MEADWEVEIGPDAPVIDAIWQGFIDLRAEPYRIGEIEEARRFPELADALVRLNAADSALNAGATSVVWTAKCDIWTTEEHDPDEMEASPEEAATAVACYLDLLPRTGLVFSGLETAEQWARGVVGQLRKVSCHRSRIDLVIRKAFVGDQEGLGVTAYITACGVNPESAMNGLSATLAAFVELLCRAAEETAY